MRFGAVCPGAVAVTAASSLRCCALWAQPGGACRAFETHRACELAINAVKEANKYLTDAAPWAVKGEGAEARKAAGEGGRGRAETPDGGRWGGWGCDGAGGVAADDAGGVRVWAVTGMGRSLGGRAQQRARADWAQVSA